MSTRPWDGKQAVCRSTVEELPRSATDLHGRRPPMRGHIDSCLAALLAPAQILTLAGLGRACRTRNISREQCVDSPEWLPTGKEPRTVAETVGHRRCWTVWSPVVHSINHTAMERTDALAMRSTRVDTYGHDALVHTVG